MKSAGGVVSLDLGSKKPLLDELLACVDMVNIPLRCLEKLYREQPLEKAAAEIMSHGPFQITVTDGTNGAHLFRANDIHHHQPAFRIEAVDTNGAGDAFCGAMIHAFLQSMPPKTGLEYASAVAAMKCRKIGNRDALPENASISQFIERNRSLEQRSAPPDPSTD